jgi:endoglucanase
LSTCVALFVSACVAPSPQARDAGAVGGAGSERAGPTVTGPRAFEHTSAELVAKLGLGWNLGNALDVPDSETAWGNPKTKPELLKAVKAAGFDLVRIPVTWTKRTGPAPDYQIDPNWMKRVEEVVGYAREAGLYAIINLHHDGADDFEGVEWLRLNDEKGETTEENNAAVRARFVAVWDQIARHFSGAGEELLFESMNEIHDGYGEPDPRHFTIVNELNQIFVDLVRKSGGNNAERHLVVPGYNTNIDHTIRGFVLPKDPTPNRLILSVHYYDPYLYALQAKVHTWGSASPGRDDWGQEDHVVEQFDRVKASYVDQGIPVIIGEYGATHQAGYEDYRRYYMEYVTQAAKQRGLLPIYWDNGGRESGGENFGLFDRNTNEVLHPQILDAMKRAAKSSAPLDSIALPKPKK